MYSIKEESVMSNVCYGCLSTDRRLTVLKDHITLFYNLLEDQQVYDPKIVLCWECRSLLNKFHVFQNRIQQAQYVLQQTFFNLNPSCEKLSTLCTSNKDYYDFTLEYVGVDDKRKEFEKQPETVELSLDVEKILTTNITIDNHNEDSTSCHEKSKRNRKKVNEYYEGPEDSNDNDEKLNKIYEIPLSKRKNRENSVISNDIPNINDNTEKHCKQLNTDYNIPNTDIKQESDEEYYCDLKAEDDNYSTDEKCFEKLDKNDKNYEQKQEKRIRYLKKYFDNVNITDSDIDMDNLRQYCTRVILNEKEIEELLERDAKEVRDGKDKKNKPRPKPFECKECGKAYKKEVDCKRHFTFNHMNREGRIYCKYCRKSIKNWTLLEKHWERHNYHFKCTICGWLARPYTVLIHHIEKNHSKIYTCLICKKQLSNMREFKRHFKETHERFKCDDCGKSFIKKRSLETHIRRHHLPPTCPICNRTYASYHNLENHYRLNHPELLRGSNDKEELAYCVECNKQFPSVYKYRRHLSNAAIHTPPKIESVPCPECGKVFSRKIRMTNHVMAVHRKTTKHRCDICNKTFCSAYSAKTHRQCVHEKIPMPKNKFCDICGRGFSTNRILANHRRTHTGERPYQCPHCPATFAQRTAMKTHAKTQHKNVMIDVLTEH